MVHLYAEIDCEILDKAASLLLHFYTYAALRIWAGVRRDRLSSKRLTGRGKEMIVPEIVLSLRAVSPVFLHGAEPGGATEWRAPSVRGQLRYWLRAIEGARAGNDLNALWKAESAVFGSTGQGSAVTVRCREGNGVRRGEERPVPHSKGFTDTAILEDSPLGLTLLTRPGVAFPDPALDALTTWLLLGGVGKRSRRMFGALRVAGSKSDSVPDDALWWKQPIQSADDLIKAARTHFSRVLGDPAGYSASSVSAFPMLHPQHSWVLIGRDGEGSVEELNARLFRKLIRSDKFLDAPMFGYVKGNNRRASPLTAQARKVGDQVVPVLTVLRSEYKEIAKMDWALMNQFLDAAMKEFNAEIVWGGPLR